MEEEGSPSPSPSKEQRPGAKEKPLPHYALPNFSVVLPTYSNRESDVISQAFRIGNFLSLQDLPARIKPGHVNRTRCQKVLDSRQASEFAGTSTGRFQPKPKYFSEFEYMPSPYSIADTIQAEERAEQAAAFEKAGHSKPFAVSDTRAKLKYEDAFHGGFRPYKGGPDPYEAADDQALRHKWLCDAKILAAPWRPAGRVKGSTGEAATERPSPSSLPEIVNLIKKDIEADWEDYEFIVCSTDDEHVVIRFELSTLDSEPGLVAYMNIFARSNVNVNKYMLTKVVEDWNVNPNDGHLYFTLRPPWVTARAVDSYYALHPEQRTFHESRMAVAKRSSNLGNSMENSAEQAAAPVDLGSDVREDARDTPGDAARPDLT